MLSNGDLLIVIPPLLNNVSALPEETLKRKKNASFLLHAVLVHCQTLTVTGLLYSAFILTTLAVATVWFPKSRRYWC